MTTLAAFTRRGTLALVLVAALASPALAGPPLVCFPFDIGTARSLPWAPDTGWKGTRSDYDVTRLTGDTTSLLSGSTPIVVRMETLRRAALYATRDATVAKGLLDQLNQRAVEAKGNGRSRALAPSMRAISSRCKKQLKPISAPTRRLRLVYSDGYAMVRQSLALSSNDPAIEIRGGIDDERRARHSRPRRTRSSCARGIVGRRAAGTKRRHPSGELNGRMWERARRGGSSPGVHPDSAHRPAAAVIAPRAIRYRTPASRSVESIPRPDAPYARSGGMTSLRLPPTFIPGTP